MHTSDIVLRILERDSELLQQQLGQYTHISKDFDTKFFYETYQTDRQSSGHITVSLILFLFLAVEVLTTVGCTEKLCGSSECN